MSDGRTLSDALLSAQSEMPHLPKTGVNPHFKSKFVPLDVVIEKALPVLHKHGLAVVQLPTTIDGRPALRTRLLHTSGEFIEDTMLLLCAKEDPQGQGAALTYARRYALTAMLALADEDDDDGNRASAAPKAQRAATAVNGAANDDLVAELTGLLTRLNATESIPRVEEKRADTAWLKRQIATATTALEKKSEPEDESFFASRIPESAKARP